MADVDKRARVSRRVILRGAALAAPAAAVAGASISPTAAWAQDAKAIGAHNMATLVQMARDIYPHDHLADVYYVRAVTAWDGKAGADKSVSEMIAGGVARLDQDARDRQGSNYLGVGWEADRVVLLRGIEHTKFFRAIRADLVVSLYNQPEIWPKFGYQGSSAEYGGYLNRGFNDIDWLPSV